MKKIPAVFFLGCLLFVVTGHSLLFLTRLHQVKKEMKKELQTAWIGQTTVLIFGEKEFSELEWEDKQEFRFDGEMYDVVSLNRKDGRFVVRCIADKKETELLETYQKLVRGRPGSPLQTCLLKLLFAPFEKGNISSLYSLFRNIKTPFVFHLPRLIKTALPVLKQPPRLSFYFV